MVKIVCFPSSGAASGHFEEDASSSSSAMVGAADGGQYDVLL